MNSDGFKRLFTRKTSDVSLFAGEAVSKQMRHNMFSRSSMIHDFGFT